MLCPLKFNLIMQGWGEEKFDTDMKVVINDLCNCEKEKCAWWIDIKEAGGTDHGIRCITRDAFKGCAIKQIAEK
jgi:hypothetical protein